MGRKYLFLGMVLVAALVAGCASTPRVAKRANGEPVALFLLSDRGIEAGMTGKQVEQLNQIGTFMEKHLLGLSTRAGYQVQLIQSRDQFTPGPGKYLLAVKITKYNPGSKAARMLVGFGAGAVSLDTHYELFGEGAAPLLVRDDGVGSSRDWIFVVDVLNKRTLKSVTEQLNKI